MSDFDRIESRIEDLEARQREHAEHMLALGKTVSALHSRASGTLARHAKLAPRIRKAIERVVGDFRAGDGELDLAALAFRAGDEITVEESLESVRRLLDDLVLAVGEVLTREDSEP